MNTSFFKLVKICFLLFPVLSGCNFDSTLDLEMEEHEKEIVVECYIQPGKPFQLVLSETSNYLDHPSVTYINDAKVTITYNNKEVHLKPNNSWIPESTKFHNFLAEDTVPELYNTDFHLEIKTQGKTIRGTTELIRPKKITGLRYRLNQEKSAYVHVEFEKDLHIKNFYRLVINKNSSTGTNYISLALHDELSPGPQMNFSTGYDFSQEELVVVTLYHITKDYYDFLESVQSAIIANANPFSQPNSVISNIEGGVGIFTGLTYDRKEILID